MPLCGVATGNGRGSPLSAPPAAPNPPSWFEFRLRGEGIGGVGKAIGLGPLAARIKAGEHRAVFELLTERDSGLEGIGGLQVGSGLIFLQLKWGSAVAPFYQSGYFQPILGYRHFAHEMRWWAGAYGDAHWVTSVGLCQVNLGLEGQNKYGVLRGNLYYRSWEVSKSFEANRDLTTRFANLVEVSGETRLPRWPALSFEGEVSLVLHDPKAWAIAYPGLSPSSIEKAQAQEKLKKGQSRMNA